MIMQITLKLVWIPVEAGGRKHVPQVGFRCGLRWQRYLDESLKMYRDVTVVSLEKGERGLVSAKCSPISEEIPNEWLRPGEGIELLDGYKVIAVGIVA